MCTPYSVPNISFERREGGFERSRMIRMHGATERTNRLSTIAFPIIFHSVFSSRITMKPSACIETGASQSYWTDYCMCDTVAWYGIKKFNCFSQHGWLMVFRLIHFEFISCLPTRVSYAMLTVRFPFFFLWKRVHMKTNEKKIENVVVLECHEPNRKKKRHFRVNTMSGKSQFTFSPCNSSIGNLGEF